MVMPLFNPQVITPFADYFAKIYWLLTDRACIQVRFIEVLN